uniref:Polyadenylate-binding protein-interacting protein 9 n=2 Tax=Noccaea caerulescens TaxID=107243 RepID=A0A1J3F676_NOCCA
MAAITERPTDLVEDVHEISINIDGEKITGDGIEKSSIAGSKTETESELKPKSEFDMKKLVAMFKKLNPLAKEFFPSYHNPKKNNQIGKGNQFLSADEFPTTKKQFGEEFELDGKKDDNTRKRRNNYSQGRRRLSGRISKAQREDSIRRTVYVSDIDQSVTEEGLAALFSNCGQVVDCRICGDPHSVLRFAFVEFADDQGAREALSLGGTMLGYYPVRVLPSKTAILPVNPTFLPRSEDEREMCTRTIYCTNIDKKVSQADVRNFFESACGEVTRLRLLGDQLHSTRIAFVEFALADSALGALNCSGMVVGSQPIRVSPSKTPVRPRITRPPSSN